MLIYGGCYQTNAFHDTWLLKRDLQRDQYEWHHIFAPAQPQAPPSPPTAPNGTFHSAPAVPPVTAAGPGDRCAHAAVPHTQGMVIFGGRVPMNARSRSSDSTWQTLSDSWFFDLNAALTGGKMWWPISNHANDDVLLNRSDHSAILKDDALMVFGGLYTDVSEGTIYIMKDFLKLTLPNALSGAAYPTTPSLPPHDWAASSERLEWGPTWRFDHTMVVAPIIVDPSNRGGANLQDAPLLYGGGGGMDIYDDLWTYDSSRRRWTQIEILSSLSKTQSIITSLLFGTVGFALYTCIIFCVFMRKVARSRQQLGQFSDVETGGNVGGSRQPRRGISPESIEALPRVSWSVAKAHAEDLEHRGCSLASTAIAASAATPLPINGEEAGGKDARVLEDMSSSSQGSLGNVVASGEEVGVSSEGAGNQPSDGGAEDSAETCSVCLCDYDAADVLIRFRIFHCLASPSQLTGPVPVCVRLQRSPADRLVVLRGRLPCEHLFHEACITRWLRQDSSCPHCRFNLQPARVAPPSRVTSAAVAAVSPPPAEPNHAPQSVSTASESVVVADQLLPSEGAPQSGISAAFDEQLGQGTNSGRSESTGP